MKQPLILTMLLLLSACTLIPTPYPTLPPDEAQAFAAQVDAFSENVLVALGNRDEAAYTRDMTGQMKAASEGAKFEELYQTLDQKIGRYVPGTRKMVNVELLEEYRRVVYDAAFTQEDHVKITVVYSLESGQPRIAGLWFDSPRLRQ